MLENIYLYLEEFTLVSCCLWLLVCEGEGNYVLFKYIVPGSRIVMSRDLQNCCKNAQGLGREVVISLFLFHHCPLSQITHILFCLPNFCDVPLILEPGTSSRYTLA